MHIWTFLRNELASEKLLDYKPSEYDEKREKVYTFLRLPMILEKFMFFGFMQCADSFLHICSFLPLRLFAILARAMCNPFGLFFKYFSRQNPSLHEHK